MRIYTLDINLTDSKELSTRSQRDLNVSRTMFSCQAHIFPISLHLFATGPEMVLGLVLRGQGCELHSREHRKYGVELRFFN